MARRVPGGAAMSSEASVFEVEAPGERLDVFLAARLEVSRGEARRLLARGVVSLDGVPVAPSAKGLQLTPGTRIEVAPHAPRAELPVTPEPEAPLVVLAAGDGWLVVDKPPGVPVHPLEEGETGTLTNAVAARHPEIQGVGEGGLRSGVVHRLDVDTSGALVVATTQPAWERLRQAFRAHRVEKVYRAIVLGEPEDEGRLELDLVVAQHRPARVKVEAGGHPTRLAWRVLARGDAACLVEVRLETGFLHQIRAGFAHLGAPLAGDAPYGAAARDDPSGAVRQMLHAARVAVDEIAAESPDPPDFADALRRAGLC